MSLNDSELSPISWPERGVSAPFRSLEVVDYVVSGGLGTRSEQVEEHGERRYNTEPLERHPSFQCP